MITLDKALEVINRDFKGKAVDEVGICLYKTGDGRKCAVGLFIPDGHRAQSELDKSATVVLNEYGDLGELMPLDVKGMEDLQGIHDGNYSNDIENLTLEEQKTYLMFHTLRLGEK